MVPESQRLNTQMAQIAYAAPETQQTEVLPEKVKITLNKTRQEGKQEEKKQKKQKTICKIRQCQYMIAGILTELPRPLKRLRHLLFVICL